MNRIVILSLLLALCSFSVFADQKNYQTKKTKTPPIIDGHLDKIWEQVEWTGDFTQTSPNEGEQPSQKTAFKILYDDNNLYVFIKAYDDNPAEISRRMSRRDGFTGDMVEINIDSDLDKVTAFSFTAMASGVKGDEAISEGGNHWDSSWDAIWYLETSVDAEGWNAEFKIPFNQLRFGKKENYIWGLQVMRHLFRKEERSHWQFIPQDSPGVVHLFGQLEGISNIDPKKQFDIIPYTLAKHKTFEKVEGNPFADGKESSVAMGVDGKIAVSNDFTLDFTVNPDFGQVEADPSEVNLSAFETYFREKRPFFIEGKSIYDWEPSDVIAINNYGRDNLFYSRRIGPPPQLYLDVNEDEYVNMPGYTTIISALKLSGKTKNGLSVGIMESITAEEKAEIDFNGQRRKVTVEPLTNYLVARVKKDYNKGKTSLGGMITAVNRDIEENPELCCLNSSAYTGGLDFAHYWKERVYYIKFKAYFSHIRGSESAIEQAQSSSSRYYQRPGADYLEYDTTKTSLTGTGATFQFGKKGDGKIVYETSFSYRSPGFEINDIGYMRSTDAIYHGSYLGYYIRKPFGIFENFYLNNNIWATWNFGGKNMSFGQNVNFNTKFKNKWRMNASFTHNARSYSINKLRGGPAMYLPGSFNYNMNVNTDSRKKIRMYGGFWHGRHWKDHFSGLSIWTGLTYQPLDALSVSLSYNYDKEDSNLQYVSQEYINGDARYIFGRIQQETMSFTLRVNLNLTPELTVQYYGQPFVSSGGYSEYKFVDNPLADEYEDRYTLYSDAQLSYNENTEQFSVDENTDGHVDYSFDKPNYNYGQFNSNLVIRWEYTPGSTLFVVWSQGRTSFNNQGVFNLSDNMSDLFDVTPTNVFLIKFSYRFSL